MLRRSALLAMCALPIVSHALEIGPGADIRGTLAGMQPGQELVLRGGTYTLSSKIVVANVATAQQPLVIRAKDGEKPIIVLPTANDNVIEVVGARYVTMKGLTIRGGSQAIRFMSSASFVTVEDCNISETADAAITANSGGTYEGLVIRGNEVHHTDGTGEGMYLGCNDDGCRVKNSLIEGNYVHHTNGATVEQGDGIEIKEGSSGNIVRNNVIHDTKYPGILTYSARGNGPANIIEGNVIWRTSDYAIQSAADATIRNNVIMGTIGFQSHQAGSPSNLTVAHNTIITTGTGIEVRNVTGSIVIANNAIYSRDGNAIALISGDLSRVTLAGNVGTGGVSGGSTGYTQGKGLAGDFINANFNGAPPIDLFPRDGSALLNAGSAAYAVELDFNGDPRSGTRDAGAYKYRSGGNPGWTIVAGFKAKTAAVVRPNPPTDVRVQ